MQNKSNHQKEVSLKLPTSFKNILNKDELYVEDFGRGFAWLDTGTHDSFMSASHFVQVIEQRQGFKIACLEELGYRNGWISKEKLMEIAVILDNTPYGKYLNLVAG